MATITLNLNAEQTARVQAALQAAFEQEEPVTLADAKQYLIEKLKQLVISYERREYERAARLSESPLDIT